MKAQVDTQYCPDEYGCGGGYLKHESVEIMTIDSESGKISRCGGYQSADYNEVVNVECSGTRHAR